MIMRRFILSLVAALAFATPALAQGTTTINNLPAANAPLYCTEVMASWQVYRTVKIPVALAGAICQSATAPLSPFAGQQWWDTSAGAGVWSLRAYDGASWLPIGRLDTTAHVWTPATNKPVQTVTGTSKTFAATDFQYETRRSNSTSAMTDTFPAAAAGVNGALITVTNADASAGDTITAGSGTTICGASSCGASTVVPAGRSLAFVFDGANTAWRPTANTASAVIGPTSVASGNLASFADSTGKTLVDAGTTASQVVTLTGIQTLTNKTLTSPVIGTIVNTGSLTLPTSSDTLVGRATTDTLTNKTLTSPVMTTPTLGVASATSLSLAGTISGSGIFGTSGIKFKNVAATLTDTTSTGTVAANYNNLFGGNTQTATSATTITNNYGSYFAAPVCSTNVTCTNNYGLGAENLSITGSGSTKVLLETTANSNALMQINTAGSLRGYVGWNTNGGGLGLYDSSGNARFSWSSTSSGVRVGSGDPIAFSSTSAASSTVDAGLSRDSVLGAGNIDVGNGTANDKSGTLNLSRVLSGDGTQSLPAFSFSSTPSTGMYLTGGNITFTVSTNRIAQFNSSGLQTGRLDLSFGGTNIITGPAAAVTQLGTIDGASPVAQTLGVQNVVAGTTNTAGAITTIRNSAGTGTGVGGNMVFQYAPHGSTGTAQNAFATAWTINGDTGALQNSAGGLTVGSSTINYGVAISTTSIGVRSDAAIAWYNGANINGASADTAFTRDSVLGAGNLDLGNGSANDKSGTLSLANVKLGANIISSSGGYVTLSSSLSVASGGAVAFGSRGGLQATADGVFALENDAGTGLSRLMLGGTTASFPAIKRNSTALNFRLADDSADAPITAGAATLSGALTTNVTGSSQCLQVNSSGVVSGSGGSCGAAAATLPTRQVLTSGSGATYTTPASVRQLRIRMVGGGGGGGGNSGSGTSGGSGGNTIFNSINAAGGNPGASDGGVGAGGAGGTGTASFRLRGQAGGIGIVGGATAQGGGTGGGSALGGGSQNNTNASANTGGGGGGAASPSGTSGGGGGGGEYVEYIINTPAGTYTYTIGAGGTAGTSAGTGGSGIIIVDEFY